MTTSETFSSMADVADAAGNTYVSCPRCPKGMAGKKLAWHLFYEHEWTAAAAIAAFFAPKA